MTQKETVIHRLNTFGEVDNFWAFHNYILRLGAIIYNLKEDGWVFDGKFGKERGYERSLWKNYYYIVSKPPEPKIVHKF